MRIVTRPDFDGVVCAVLLYEAEKIKEQVKWVQPNDMQKGLVDVHEGDIIANLPYDKGARCGLIIILPTESTNRLKVLLRSPLQRQASFMNIIKADFNEITAN
jgi:hypothetical protein